MGPPLWGAVDPHGGKSEAGQLRKIMNTSAEVSLGDSACTLIFFKYIFVLFLSWTTSNIMLEWFDFEWPRLKSFFFFFAKVALLFYKRTKGPPDFFSKGGEGKTGRFFFFFFLQDLRLAWNLRDSAMNHLIGNSYMQKPSNVALQWQHEDDFGSWLIAPPAQHPHGGISLCLQGLPRSHLALASDLEIIHLFSFANTLARRSALSPNPDCVVLLHFYFFFLNINSLSGGQSCVWNQTKAIKLAEAQCDILGTSIWETTSPPAASRYSESPTTSWHKTRCDIASTCSRSTHSDWRK